MEMFQRSSEYLSLYLFYLCIVLSTIAKFCEFSIVKFSSEEGLLLPSNILIKLFATLNDNILHLLGPHSQFASDL